MAMRAWPKDEQTVDDDPWGKFRGGLAAKTLSTTASTIQVTLPDSFVSATLGDSLLLGSSLDGRTYPRIISALQLLEESDDESIFCGPPSDSEGTALSAEARALKVLGIAHPDDERIAREAARAVAKAEAAEAAERRRLQKVAAAAEAKEAADGEGLKSARDAQPAGQADTDKRRQSAALIQPKGDAAGDNQKFICQFPVGLGDDEEFCLVKRILGKNGNNMRRIAEDCNAKVRLRGIGSGFLEGADGTEANMPLQLNVSCTDFESYSDAVDRVAALLKDLYKHYRRYARSKGMEPPDVKVALEEVRRDDLHHDTLPQKAPAQQSQRARERRVLDRERQPQQRDGGAAGAADAGDSEEGTDNSADESKSQARPPTLPGGIPVPTTAAGRRAAARTGGALVAAMASAAAREQDRIDREKQKEKGGDRDRRRGNEVDSRTPGAERSAPSHGSRGSAPIGSPADKPQEWSWDRDWNWDRDREWDQNWSWSSWREADGGGGWDKEKSHCAGWDKEKEGGDWDKEKSHGAGWEKANEGGGREQERSRGTGWDKEKGDGGWHGAGWDQESGAAGIGAAVTKVPPPPPGPPPDDATPTRGKDKSSKGASKDKGKGGKGSSRQR